MLEYPLRCLKVLHERKSLSLRFHMQKQVKEHVAKKNTKINKPKASSVGKAISIQRCGILQDTMCRLSASTFDARDLLFSLTAATGVDTKSGMCDRYSGALQIAT